MLIFDLHHNHQESRKSNGQPYNIQKGRHLETAQYVNKVTQYRSHRYNVFCYFIFYAF